MFAGLIAATALMMPVQQPEPQAPLTPPVAELALSIHDALAAIDVQSIEPQQGQAFTTASLNAKGGPSLPALAMSE
ncbi:hypothetical protein PVT67_13080 [Gallaecimonas kandeliae]|uniref:hypothetical protein n=1 Tax=Gallaecimonas kandeliae TaxID=3029055 RepID=UPI002648AB04|nr:hypothetical protein [Gallaecimonas kandeliae]WKE64595.1 hypothetical protein PVT67_13080 [Gallaecimonas kandeliae]